MVYFFTSNCGEYTIYMGKDKFENDELIKFGLPEDVWFHVDDLSSAHVYLRMKPGMVLDDITEDLLLQCSSLVKANSIAGCKVSDRNVRIKMGSASFIFLHNFSLSLSLTHTHTHSLSHEFLESSSLGGIYTLEKPKKDTRNGRGTSYLS